MSAAILWLTIFAWILPIVAIGLTPRPLWPFSGGVVSVIYAWIWLRFRPTRFVVSPAALDVEWPLKRVSIERHTITAVRAIDRDALRREIGWGLRVGAGGVWGGFGWLWTKRRGIVQMYISRTDGFVWIERADDRPWLITPESPARFVQAMSTGSMAE
jgi:hypothetical protein